MYTKKLRVVVLLVLVGVVGYLSWQLHEMRSTLDETRSALQQSEVRIDELQVKLDTLDQAENQNASIGQANENLGEISKADSGKRSESSPSFTTFASRLLGTRLLVAFGSHADEDSDIYAVLVERRDVAENRILDPDADSSVARDLVRTNKALDDAADSIAIFDALPEGDARKESLRRDLFRDLVEAGRYEDAAKNRPYWAISRIFDTAPYSGLSGKLMTFWMNQEHRNTHRKVVVELTALNIEMLAGIGDVEHAIDLTARVLDYDNSPETISLLEDHLSRVGGEDILAMLTD